MREVLSYGGGLDSFAMLLLTAIADGAPPEVCVFVDVSDGTAPGEWPGTYRHMREVVMPLCAAHGIEFVWLDTESYPVRGASSLFAWMQARHQIPVAGPNRICTRIAKVERFERWMADRFPGEDVRVWIGFEAGEERRAAQDPNAGEEKGHRKNRFPLIEKGLCRCRCEALVRAAGYPVPRKSACVFCPYGSLTDWKTLARELPAVFAEVARLEVDKPPTRSGKKLSIMGYRSTKDADGNVTGYRAPPLPLYVQGRPTGKRKPCAVCGAEVRATKATACGYLEDAA